MMISQEQPYCFYVLQTSDPLAPMPTLPDGYRAVTWTPKPWSIVPSCLLLKMKDQNQLSVRHLVFFWLYYYVTCFLRKPVYYISLVFCGSDLAHFSIVRTRDFRFSFMRDEDLQVGPVWTHPSHRGRGLASSVLRQIVLSEAVHLRRVWWICLKENKASNQVASNARLSFVATGLRRNRLGMHILGNFVQAEAAESCSNLTDFNKITEIPGLGATQDQLSILYTRYHWAAGFVKGRDILEVACGAGVGLGYLAREARLIVGGDIDERNLRLAKETYEGRPRIVIAQFDAQRMPFSDRSFDVVILFEALYYLPDPDAFVREALRVLRTEGVLLISSVHRSWLGFCPSPFSQRYFNHSELTEILVRNGFDCTLYAGFSEKASGPVDKIVKRTRRLAVRLELIPRTMKGKEWLKRLFYGRLTPIPRELTEVNAYLEPLVEMSKIQDPTNCRMIYAVGRKRAENAIV